MGEKAQVCIHLIEWITGYKALPAMVELNMGCGCCDSGVVRCALCRIEFSTPAALERAIKIAAAKSSEEFCVPEEM